MMFRPIGEHALTPCIVVLGAPLLLDFLVDALGGSVQDQERREDGSIVQARVRLGDTVVMVIEAGRQFSPMCGAYCLDVENIDATMARALLGGATLDAEVSDTPAGRQARVVDPFGNLWWLAEDERISQDGMAP
ncbi:putative glyoxalase superfamily protein PhnB [Sphaerotilus hippei]|uniref:Putative glyoxalase superfamily protein PhnB n=1 Tax=Sphaerotilus hippei TaxID=744406 RepID=A0A318GZ49_9BURK|nr:VOC family protein [Sphaerotilus hippei]PXW95492.1 putative glyoxalase superfamily protein PhnB [Sphaerotilus hippei]